MSDLFICVFVIVNTEGTMADPDGDIFGESSTIQVHAATFHNECLDKLCRVCSKRLLSAKQKKEKSRKIREVKKHQVSIKDTYGIDVASDNYENKHPRYFCHSCMMGIYNSKRNPNSQDLALKKLRFQSINDRWNAFDESVLTMDCFSCVVWTEQAKGGKGSEFIPENVDISSKPCVNEKSDSNTKENCNITGNSHTNDHGSSPTNSARQPLKEIQTPPNNQKLSGKGNETPITVPEFLQSPEPSENDDKLLYHIIKKYPRKQLIRVKTPGKVNKRHFHSLRIGHYLCRGGGGVGAKTENP